MAELPRRWKPVLLFFLLLLLFPAVTSLVRWLAGESLELLEWLGVVAFPFRAWLWLRHFSVLACRRGCMPPDQPGQ
jgi:hypothetical protein